MNDLFARLYSIRFSCEEKREKLRTQLKQDSLKLQIHPISSLSDRGQSLLIVLQNIVCYLVTVCVSGV